MGWHALIPAHRAHLSAAAVCVVLALALASPIPAREQQIAQPAASPGGLLTPTLTVEHHGRLLVLICRPESAEKVRASNTRPHGDRPQWAIYKKHRLIASGQLGYG
jgi:hypothetical protein